MIFATENQDLCPVNNKLTYWDHRHWAIANETDLNGRATLDIFHKGQIQIKID